MLRTRASSAPFTSLAASYLTRSFHSIESWQFEPNSHGYNSSVRSTNKKATGHCSFTSTTTPDQFVVPLVHRQASHQGHVMARLAEVERINLKVGVGAERGIELLRCGPCSQVDRHLENFDFGSVTKLKIFSHLWLRRPCYVCCSVHFLHLHPEALNQPREKEILATSGISTKKVRHSDGTD